MSFLPCSWTNTVLLFRPQESLTCPVNRHTSLVHALPAALSSFRSPRDSQSQIHKHTHVHSHSSTQKHKQAPVKYLTTLPSSAIICYTVSACLLPCLFSRLICCLCCLSFLPFLLVICSVISMKIISPWPKCTKYILP